MKNRTVGILGSFDGVTSALGVLWTFALTGSYHGLVVAAISLAFGSSVSMGGGEWLGEDTTDWWKAGLMTGSFLVGSLAPAVPFFLGHGVIVYICSSLIALCVVAVIAKVRPQPFVSSFVRTFIVLIIATVIAIAAGLIANQVG